MKSIIVESKTCTAGSFHDQTSSPAPILGQSAPDNSIHQDIRHPIVSGYYSGYGVPGDRPVHGPSPPNSKQVSQNKAMMLNRAPQGIPPCPYISTQCGSVMPPPPVQTSFVCPVYPGPGSLWENTIPNPPFSHISPRMMPGSNFRGNPSGPFPFISSSVAPLAQLPGSSAPHSEIMPPPAHPTNLAPPPFTAPPPPPLPISQLPSMAPLPSCPPHPQFIADSSNLKMSCSHPRWQGSLSKSGLHYCKIYTTRLELDACRYESSVSEPAEWPSKLDMTRLTYFQHVKTNFSNSPPSKRGLLATALFRWGSERAPGFHNLSGTKRTLWCDKDSSCENHVVTASIYPPTAEVCSMLALPPHPADCPIALILPKEANVEAA